MDKYVEKVKEIFEEYKYQAIFGLLICMVLLGTYIFINKTTTAKPTEIKAENHYQKEKNDNKIIKNRQAEQIFVDVKGAVLNPGVYQATPNMRGTDLIKMAGGFNEHADRNHVNLAKKVTDQEILYIPVLGEINELPATNISNEGKTSNSSDNSNNKANNGDKVNLNEADVAKMQTINGVGQKKAEKIIDYRNQNGPFKTVDDLKNVPGFGERTVANLKSSLSV